MSIIELGFLCGFDVLVVATANAQDGQPDFVSCLQLNWDNQNTRTLLAKYTLVRMSISLPN
jgi:hypothetical protein